MSDLFTFLEYTVQYVDGKKEIERNGSMDFVFSIFLSLSLSLSLSLLLSLCVCVCLSLSRSLSLSLRECFDTRPVCGVLIQTASCTTWPSTLRLRLCSGNPGHMERTGKTECLHVGISIKLHVLLWWTT